MADTHGSVYDTTAFNAITASMPVLAQMIGGAINSAVVNLVRPSPHAAVDDPVTMLIIICLSTAALAAIIRIVGVVMTSKHWAVSFISTALRLGFSVVCLVKVLTGMTVSFL